ncbi:hypothetical protein NSK_005134 [Nannochloropsis salina CCMP1776]|uniref:Uncharacterized protein n=1 Tax=Nannochloropsis salina CCMP1776 TaxID=1027361 RepID=A0A4D9D634_9STRA|nr:hypothetical protein NSK_005134 [Nannochloropsis salina CCMP1776]|eukprot:TFJ84039.1 hypothetical protein NSK_005134 [Nannochloropsis salina CCMP1776]
MPPPRTVKDILALDFDGVLCNSVEESSQAAFRSVKKMWPQLATYCAPVGGASANECPGWLSDSLRHLRPLVETGYENVLLARLCMEKYLQGQGSTPDIHITDLAGKWQTHMRSALLHRYGVTAQELLYGSVRDEWLGTDAEGWVKANAFYAGTDLSLHCPRFESYVVTTKQTRFVEALIGAKGEGGGEGGRKGRGGGIDLPRERIYGLGSGPKTDILARMLHFVEDRVETLEKVCGDPRLQNVQLYLADWGYTTDAARERAMLNPRIQILQLADFACMCQALGAREGEGGGERSSCSFACLQAACTPSCGSSGNNQAVEKIVFQSEPPPSPVYTMAEAGEGGREGGGEGERAEAVVREGRGSSWSEREWERKDLESVMASIVQEREEEAGGRSEWEV